MDFISILSALSEWALFALALSAVILALIISSYLFYKKKLHGKHEISKIKFVAFFLILGWFLVVLGLTTLSRGANFAADFNFNLFSGYVNAWNKWSLSELQMILFNMLMFLPLGFLLPLLSKKTERFRVVLFLSLAFTLGIELLQLATSTGIFELDDLFHNVLGSIIGYQLIMGILGTLREKRLNWKNVRKALAIPFCIVLLLTGAFTAYQLKELGNMPILPAARQNMDEVIVSSDIIFSDDTKTVSLYKDDSVNNLDHGKAAAEIISSKFGLSISGPTRIEGTNRILTLRDQAGNPLYFNFFMQNGTWDVYSESLETAASSENLLSQKEDLEEWLLSSGLLQENAEFQLQDETTLRWDLEAPSDITTRESGFHDGFIMITLSENNLPLNFMSTVSEKKYLREVEIISPKQAFQRVQGGEFEIYNPLQKGDRLFVSGYEISYLYDTKGYYQPVYQFSGYINDQDYPWSCFIPAVSGAN